VAAARATLYTPPHEPMATRAPGAGRTDVAVITPCHNAAAFIGATMRSILAQTLSHWEHIVVDDGSTDRSADVALYEARDDPRIRVVQQPNRGVAAARNTGFRASDPHARYVLFLDADDLPKPTMLERLVGYMDDRPAVGVVYCELDFIDANGEPLPHRDWNVRWVPSRFGLRRLPASVHETPFASLFSLAAGQPSRTLIRRSVYLRAGGWDEEFGQICEDTDLLLRLGLEAPVHYLDEPLLLQRIHAASATSGAAATYAAQEERLYRLWRLREADPRTGPRIAAARRFREQRVLPRLGIEAGVRRLAGGDLRTGSRFILGAARMAAAARWRARSDPSATPQRRRSQPEG
jgi:glycosyltransferase involved in cell wall biosynthesis